MKRGDIVEFKREGIASAVLGSVLKIFERDWDAWGWHLGIAWEETNGGWYILEALGSGVETNIYLDEYLKENTRNYSWLDDEPSQQKLLEFLTDHLNQKYDVAVYLWTSLQYLVRHFFNHRIPRLLDERWTCWELVFEFCEDMGKRIGSKYDCPMITDFLKAIKERRG